MNTASAIVIVMTALIHGADQRRRLRLHHQETRKEGGRGRQQKEKDAWAVFFTSSGSITLTIRLILIIIGMAKDGAKEGCLLVDIIGEVIVFATLFLWASSFPSWSSSPAYGLLIALATSIARSYDSFKGTLEKNLTRWEVVEETLDSCALIFLGGVMVTCLRAAHRSRKDKRRRRMRTITRHVDDGDHLEDPLLDDEEEENHRTLYEHEDDEGSDYHQDGAPLDQAGFFSRLGFSWVNPLLDIGAKRQLVYDDVPELPEDDNTRSWSRRFNRALVTERLRAPTKPSLLRAAQHTFGSEYYYLGALQVSRSASDVLLHYHQFD